MMDVVIPIVVAVLMAVGAWAWIAQAQDKSTPNGADVLAVYQQYVETIRGERHRLEEDVANLAVRLRQAHKQVADLQAEKKTLEEKAAKCP